MEFDKTFYKRVYTDLRFLNDAQLAHHYITTGKKESRLGSEHQLNKFIDSLPYKFDHEVYNTLYSDVPGDETLAKIHLYMHGYKEGRVYNIHQAKNTTVSKDTNISLVHARSDTIEVTKPIVGNKRLNILIHTHDKPNTFRYCLNSVLTQTYKNIHIYICARGLKDVEYVNKLAIGYENITIVQPDNYTSNSQYNYELYNTLTSCVGKGWLLYLDENDELSSPHTLASIYRSLKTDSCVSIWRHGRDPEAVRTLDRVPDENETPAPVSTFCVPVKLVNSLNWSPKKHAAHFFMKSILEQPSVKTNILDEVLIKSQQTDIN